MDHMGRFIQDNELEHFHGQIQTVYNLYKEEREFTIDLFMRSLEEAVQEPDECGFMTTLIKTTTNQIHSIERQKLFRVGRILDQKMSYPN